MVSNKGLKPFFKMDPIFQNDLFRPEIKTNLIKFIIAILLMIWVYLKSTTLLDTKLLIYPFIFWFLFNFLYFFVDHSENFSKHSFNHDFHEFKTDNMEILTSRMNFKNVGIFSKSKFEKIEELKRSNLLFFHNLQNNRLISTMGLELKSTAHHIHSNLEDLLRKISQLQDFIPLNFQIEIKNVSNISKEDEKFSIFRKIKNFEEENHNKKNQTIIAYQIFFSRTIQGINSKKIQILLQKMRHICTSLQEIIEMNFPHYKFSVLEGNQLYNAIRSSASGKYYDIEQVIKNERGFSKKVIDAPYLKYFSKYLSIVSVNFVFLCLFSALISSKFNILLYFSLSYFFYGFFYLKTKYFSLFFFKHKNHFNNYHSLNLFPEKILQDKYTHRIHVYDEVRQRLYSKVFISWKQYYRKSNLNNMKMYRSLMSKYANSPYSLTHNIFIERFIPTQIKEYKNHIRPMELKNLENNCDQQKEIERRYCGFYKISSLFSISLELAFDQFESKIDYMNHDLDTKIVHMKENFIQSLDLAYPSFEMKELPSATFFPFISKSKKWSSYRSPFHIFFDSGKSISILISIPDEIHKTLPIYYAGEFSTPYLSDNLIFGHALNLENSSLETPGGMNSTEIKNRQNILISGENSDSTHKASLRMGYEFIKTLNNMIIFDWDGSWNHLIGKLNQNIPELEKDILLYKVGENFGLKLFDLPISEPNDGAYITYINMLMDCFVRALQWNANQTSLLKSVILEDINKHKSIDEVIIFLNHKFGKSIIKKYESEVYSLLLMLKTQYLKSAFDESIYNYIKISKLFNHKKTIILNLERIPTSPLKNLFIQLFLMKLSTLDELQEPNKHLQRKIIFIPELHKIFPRIINKYSEPIIADPLFILKNLGYSILSETNQIGAVNNSILSYFPIHFAFNTTQHQNKKVLVNLLNIDNSFTNISKNSSRNNSYQLEYLSRLEDDKAFVYRPQFKKPYIFQFNFDHFLSNEKIIDINLKNIEHFQQFQPIPVNLQMKNKKVKGILEIDFDANAFLLSELNIFLNDCKNKLHIMEILEKHQMLEDLSSLVEDKLRGYYGEDISGRKNKIRNLLEDFIALGYFRHKNLQLHNSIDMEGYDLTEKAYDALNEYKKNKLIAQIPREKREESQKKLESQEYGEYIKSEKNQEIGMINATYKKNTSQQFENSFEWMNNTREYLFETIVNSRNLLYAHGFDDSFSYLEKCWSSLISDLDLVSNARSIWKSIKEEMKIIQSVKKGNINQLQRILEKLEDFAIRI